MSTVYLQRLRTNHYGNHCYKEIRCDIPKDEMDEPGNRYRFRFTEDDGITFLSLDVVWVVESPSEQCKSLVNRAILDWSYPDFHVRSYGGKEFLLNREAAEKIPPEELNGGECAVVETRIDGDPYFLLVADNKKYIGNVAGSVEDGESEGEAIVRGLRGELGLVVKKENIKEIGFWTYVYKNALFGTDYSNPSHTIAFYVFVECEKLRHLLPSEGKMDRDSDFFVIDADDVVDDLHETEMVIFVGARNVDRIPEIIRGKTFGGRHRELVRIFSGLERNSPKNFSYLLAFEIERS